MAHLGGLISQLDPRIDNQAVQGLAGTPNSLAYITEETEHHFHSPLQIYGLTANTMARKSTSPIIVTGGTNAWGTEIEIHNGTVIEGGSASKMFDMNTLFVSAVSATNNVTYLEFYQNTLAAGIAATTQAAGDTLTKNGHGLANGTRIQLNSIVTSTGIDTFTIYYVVGTALNTFQLSLTLGGAAVNIQTGDGTCNYQVVTQALITESIVSKASATAEVFPRPMQMDRHPCNARISCRGWATGAPNAISFFLGLHTYPS